MTDAELERIGREWAGERGKRPRWVEPYQELPGSWYWDSDEIFTHGGKSCIPSAIWDVMIKRAYAGTGHFPTEPDAYVALGKAVAACRDALAPAPEARDL